MNIFRNFQTCEASYRTQMKLIIINFIRFEYLKLLQDLIVKKNTLYYSIDFHRLFFKF